MIVKYSDMHSLYVHLFVYVSVSGVIETALLVYFTLKWYLIQILSIVWNTYPP